MLKAFYSEGNVRKKKKKHWKTLERFSILSPSEKDKTLEGLRI